MRVAFNEIDAVACAVLRENFTGDVLERSIKDVRPEDIAGYERVHWFAGAGLWEVACEIAGWAGSIWTASCPCQPFSVAGKGAGEDDPRHLWPDLFRLVRVCRPPVLVGEQVGGAAGDAWLDRVGADLESEGFTFWAAEAPACSVNAPHQRPRNWWAALADSDGGRCEIGRRGEIPRQWTADDAPSSFDADRVRAMADADRGGRGGRPEDALGGAGRRDAAERADDAMGDASGARLALGSLADVERRALRDEGATARQANHGSFWMDAEWLQCADGKARRAKPGIRLLVDGMAGRADLWRLAGNSIVPQLAAQVLIALKETLEDSRRSVRVDDLFG